jgi:hypothetical protein
MEKTIHTLKKTARLAGYFYLLNVVISIYGIIFISSKISTQGVPTEIVNILIANEFLFRSGIYIRLINSIPWVLLALSLYQLLKSVNNFQAKLMFAWMILSIPIGFIAEAFNISGIMIAKGELLKSIDIIQRKEYAILFLNMSNNIISISEMFWGLWLLPFGLLIYKSGFIPSLIGILLILCGVGYILDCSVFLLFPMYKTTVSQFTLLFGSAGEITIMLWLLIKGVKTNFSVS